MSSLAEKLKAVKLKSPDEPVKDFSSPKTAGFMKMKRLKVAINNTERTVCIFY